MKNSFILLLLSSTFVCCVVDAAVWEYEFPIPPCRNITFSDGSQEPVCLTRTWGSSSPPTRRPYENGIQPDQLWSSYYTYSRGAVLQNGTTLSMNEDIIGTVSIDIIGRGFAQSCFVSINDTECCSCSSCLAANGTVVAMKADCTNIPNGRLVSECESTDQFFPQFFPLDFSYDGASQECDAESPIFSGPTNISEPTNDQEGTAPSDSKETSSTRRMFHFPMWCVFTIVLAGGSELGFLLVDW